VSLQFFAVSLQFFTLNLLENFEIATRLWRFKDLPVASDTNTHTHTCIYKYTSTYPKMPGGLFQISPIDVGRKFSRKNLLHLGCIIFEVSYATYQFIGGENDSNLNTE